MCWSLPVSLGSYALVCTLSAALYWRNWQTDRWYALWLLFVGQIQLCEAALWLDQQCGGGLNEAAGLVLLGIISLEPLVHSLIAVHCTPAKLRSRWQWGLVQLSAAFGAVVWAIATPGTTDWCTRPCGAGQHLRWPWTDQINDPLRLIFLFLISVPFAWQRPRSHGVVGISYTCAIFAASFLLFKSSSSFESMWCWLAVFGYSIPLLLCRRGAA